MIIPDLVEPVVGWRAWRIIEALPREPRLRPFAGELVDWPAGVPTFAVCADRRLGGTLEPHDPPGVGCSCGLYAHKTLGQLWAGHTPTMWPWPTSAAEGASPGMVWGRVSLWGRVLEYYGGYRAQAGYPQHLWTDGDAAVLRDRYLIPVSPLSELIDAKPPESEIVDPGLPPGTYRRGPKVWTDQTGGRADRYYPLIAGAPIAETFEFAWPTIDVARLIAGVARGHLQRAICIGVFQPGGCQPHRWMDTQGACTPKRLGSLRDVLSKLAGRGVTIKRIPGQWGGEFGATYQVTAIGPDPVAAPRPRVRKEPPVIR